MIKCKVIDKNKMTLSYPGAIHIKKSLKDINTIRDVNNFLFFSPSCETNKIVDIEECNQIINITGTYEPGPDAYIQNIRIAKAFVEILQNCNSDEAKRLLSEYKENGWQKTEWDITEWDITLWHDRISSPNAVIAITVGSLIIPFSFADYILEKSDKAKETQKLLNKYKIPYMFGRIYPSVDVLHDSVKRSEEVFEFDNGIDPEIKINQRLMTLEPTEENKNLIILLGLKERYRQTVHSIRQNMKKLEEIVNQSKEMLN